MSSALRGRAGFAYQYIPRAQAFSQLLAQIWSAPAAGRLNRAISTLVITGGLAVCFKMIYAESSDPCRRVTRTYV